MTGSSSLPRGQTTCAVRAFSVVEASAGELAALRKQPGPPNGLPTASNLLNHAEDQTVAALAAVLRAIHAGQLQNETFTDWAVIAAPRYPGRVPFAASLEKFRRLQTLSVSPLIIPFMSLHSVSSLISLALHSQGPSFGLGGGSDGFLQAMQVGLSLQHDQDLPGIWVVATGWDPEIVPESRAEDAAQPVCRAAALALLPATAGATGSQLRLVPRTRLRADDGVAPTLPDLVRFLTVAARSEQARNWACPLNADYDLELTVHESGLSWLARSA